MDAEAKRLVLFDGVCNFCNDAVLFIVDRDPEEHFKFASLQSDAGQKILRERGCDPDIQSIVLVEGERTYLRSTAALRIARGLRFPWPLFFYAFVWVPAGLRDLAYSYFAKNRYRWFGKSEQCRIPTPALRRRILDAGP